MIQELERSRECYLQGGPNHFRATREGQKRVSLILLLRQTIAALAITLTNLVSSVSFIVF